MAKSLTIGEMAKIEELSGLSVAQFDDNDKPRGLFMAAMAFVVKKREEPKLTFDGRARHGDGDGRHHRHRLQDRC